MEYSPGVAAPAAGRVVAVATVNWMMRKVAPLPAKGQDRSPYAYGIEALDTAVPELPIPAPGCCAPSAGQ